MNQTAVARRRTEKARKADMAAEAVRRMASAIDVVSVVKDVISQPGTPDPVQSQACVLRLRQLLGVRAETAKPSPKWGPGMRNRPKSQDRLPGIGPGPYAAAIVRTTGGDPIWTSGRRYGTEWQAQQEIIRKATILKHGLAGYTHHWITEKREHVIDYGSHAFYGRITSIEDK